MLFILGYIIYINVLFTLQTYTTIYICIYVYT